MNRRNFMLKGGTSIGTLAISSGMLIMYRCQMNPASDGSMDNSLGIKFLNELGEIILPKTDTPGAEAAKVGEYVAMVVEDCFSDEDKLAFDSNVAGVEEECKDLFGRPFLDCNSEEREALVSKLDASDEGFKSIKGLLTSAYLSSEIGQSQFFKFNPVPGKYDGCSDVMPW